MVPTDDEDLQILDRSFDVFAEFATNIRYVNTGTHHTTTADNSSACSTRSFLVMNGCCFDQHLGPTVTFRYFFLPNNSTDKQHISNLKHLPQQVTPDSEPQEC